MGRISVCDPALGHYCLEEIDHCLVVGHEPVLVFKLVEENVLAVNPDVGISDFSVDRNLSFDLVGWVVFCRAQVWLAELAVVAPAPHEPYKPLSCSSHQVPGLSFPKSPGGAGEPWGSVDVFFL